MPSSTRSSSSGRGIRAAATVPPGYKIRRVNERFSARTVAAYGFGLVDALHACPPALSRRAVLTLDLDGVEKRRLKEIFEREVNRDNKFFSRMEKKAQKEIFLDVYVRERIDGLAPGAYFLMQ